MINWQASIWERMNCGLLQRMVSIMSLEQSHPFCWAASLRNCAMSAPWDKTLPVTALVSPSSAFSSYLTFSIVRVGSGMPGRGWREGFRGGRKTALCKLVAKRSCRKTQESKIEWCPMNWKWRDCLLCVYRRETQGVFCSVRSTFVKFGTVPVKIDAFRRCFFPYYLYSCAFRVGRWHLSLSSGSPAESRVYKSLINTWSGDQILKFRIYSSTYKDLAAWINIPLVALPGVTRMWHFSRSVTLKCWHLAEAKCKWNNHKYLETVAAFSHLNTWKRSAHTPGCSEGKMKRCKCLGPSYNTPQWQEIVAECQFVLCKQLLHQ